MKLKKIFLALTLLLGFAWATPASAELKFGVVGGLNLSKMSFSGSDKGLLSSDNRCGWYIASPPARSSASTATRASSATGTSR